jgi:hypothetical protein
MLKERPPRTGSSHSSARDLLQMPLTDLVDTFGTAVVVPLEDVICNRVWLQKTASPSHITRFLATGHQFSAPAMHGKSQNRLATPTAGNCGTSAIRRGQAARPPGPVGCLQQVTPSEARRPLQP